MPTLDTRPGALDLLVRPGNAVTLQLTWPSALTGRTFTATVDGTALSVSIVGAVMTIVFSAATTTALTGRPTWKITETTSGSQVRITGRVLLTTSPTTSQTVSVTVLEDTNEVTVSAIDSNMAASVLLGLIKTVDGAGSGLDADLLDGLSSAAFEQVANKGTAGGYASLDGSGTVPDAQIPATITRDSELSAAVTAAIDALIGGAPGALDTLNELAAAINDDASFAATVTTALAGKQPLDADLTALAAGGATATSWLTALLNGTYVGGFEWDGDSYEAGPVRVYVGPEAPDVGVGSDGDIWVPSTPTELAVVALDADVVHDTGNETVAGVKTFTSAPVVPADVYDSSWNGLQEPAPKDALWDALGAVSANGKSLITAADYAAMRTLLNLIPGTDVQAYDADLAAIAALVSAANKIAYATGSGTWSLTDFTAAARALLDDADASAMLTTLGVSTFIKTLLDDADAATARGTLGLNPVVAETTSDVAINTDNTERTYATLATPTGLAAGDRLHLRCAGNLLNNSGSSVNFTWRLKLGATTFATSTTLSIGTTANRRNWIIDVTIALVSTSSERMSGLMIISGGGTAELPLSPNTTAYGSLIGAATEDLSTSKNVVLTCEMGTSGGQIEHKLTQASLTLNRKV